MVVHVPAAQPGASDGASLIGAPSLGAASVVASSAVTTASVGAASPPATPVPPSHATTTPSTTANHAKRAIVRTLLRSCCAVGTILMTAAGCRISVASCRREPLRAGRHEVGGGQAPELGADG